jgi:hypothetical protein
VDVVATCVVDVVATCVVDVFTDSDAVELLHAASTSISVAPNVSFANTVVSLLRTLR